MTRNLWGWGDTAHAADLDSTRARVEPFFGAVEPKTAQAPRVPQPRIQIPAALTEFCVCDDTTRAAHAMGKSYVDRVRGFGGDFSSAPDMVASPRTEQEVEAALAAATAARLSVTPFGGGSSVVGGVEPQLGPGHNGTLCLDLSRLDQVLEVDDISHTARIQAGVMGPALERQLSASGFTLRHFPQSFEYSSLGGWIATRAGGHFATLYTHIDGLVQSARMLTPRGTWQSAQVPASGAGVDVNRIMLGSEGTLGVITEAWMRVRRKPVFRAQASVMFSDFEAAVNATREVAQAGLYPANCRLLDAQEAMLNAVASGGGPVLVLAFESADHSVVPYLERALEITSAHGGTCPNGPRVRSGENAPRADDAADSWRASFLKGPYLQDAMIQLGILADTFETACTWRAFPELYTQVTQAMREALERVCGSGLVTCRFTHVYPDGPAPYFTFLGRARRGGELDQWAELKRTASDALQQAGGTITHHHAVGRTHRPWFDREIPRGFIDALAALKRQVDPQGLLNSGVLFDPAR